MSDDVTHTPGPWSNRRENLFDDVGDGIKIRDTAKHQIVAVVRGPLTVHRSLEEWEANAHLIAAAPDLLAGCELAMEHLVNEESLNACRAAIAKAKGGAS